jgi:Holliday junction resolvase-like predicted endonuclease
MRDVRFVDVEFREGVSFEGTRFAKLADFSESIFPEANFSKAKFPGMADFSECEFARTAVFKGARFNDCVGFRKARFKGKINFARARFEVEPEICGVRDGKAKSHIEICYLISEILNGKSASEKGRLLEKLIYRMLSGIKGFRLTPRVRTATEEIDIVILNKSEHGFWGKLPLIILVECKNRSSKCGKNDLVSFEKKILNRKERAKMGFFISWKGFTKTFEKELLRTSQGGILIIPVTGKEILEAIEGGDLQQSIEKWFIKAAIL